MISNDFEEIGYDLIEQLIEPNTVTKLIKLLDHQPFKKLKGGIRNIERLVPEVKQLANSTEFINLAGQYLSGKPSLVRAIYFNKSVDSNWYVTWHQDKTVAVTQRFECENWQAWSLKANIWHVQPPLEVMQQLVTIRLHLDPALKSNGCLKVLPGSHRLGYLDTTTITQLKQKLNIIYCEVPMGGAVVMRPLIVHASDKAMEPKQRRVLHFEYSNYILPTGIAWSA